MRRAAVIKTADDEEHDREAAMAARRARATLAERRKAKMLMLEEARAARETLSELEQEEEEEKDRARLRAGYTREETKDAVKAMNSMVAYAKTVTIRDRQVLERKARLEKEKEAQRILDLEVEITRLEEMRKFQQRDEELRARRVVARKGIQEQLEESQRRKEAAAVLRKKEAEEAVARIKRMEVEDRAAELSKRDAKARLRAEVKAANEASIAARKQQHAREVAEDRALEEAQAAETEAAILAEMEKEKQRLRREEEFFKLRGMVEKFQDNTEAVAETRMRRAFEEGQRKDREAAERRAQQQREAEAELRRAREEQTEYKTALRAAEIERERQEFDRAQAAKKQWMDAERAERERRRAKDRSHVQQVLQQAEEHQSELKMQALKTREAGSEGAHATDAEMEELDRIRQRKLRELRAAGVESKYGVELQRFRPRAVIEKDFKLGPPRARKSTK
jgi:hypothetical protein